MLTVHELARKGHFNIRDSQLSALCGYKHPVLVNWGGGEEETQSWKWPRVQEGFFFFSRRFSWLQTNRSREASPELKSHFYPRLASCAAKRHFNCFPFSRSHKASSLPEYTNYHPFFFCTQLKIIASSGFQSAALCVLHSLKLFWWVNSRRGKIKDGCWAAGLFVPSGGFSDFSYSAIVLMWS